MAMKTLFFILMVTLMVVGTKAQVTLNGIVPCSTNVTLTNILNTPIFPGALLQLLSGSNTLGNATTNNNGIFSMVLGTPLNLLTNSVMVVSTPLIKCNVSLPATGKLVSNLTSVISGLIPKIPLTINLGIESFMFVV